MEGWFYSAAVIFIIRKFLKKKFFFLGNSCPLWQAVLLGMQFQNSNLKLLFRIVYQYYWENNLSCKSSHNALSMKNLGLLFHSAFRNTSVHAFQLLVVGIVHWTYCWYCVLEVWVWGMSNNCGAIIAWVLGIVETSVESMYLTLQFLFLFQFRLWWWTLLICMHRPYTIICLFWSI